MKIAQLISRKPGIRTQIIWPQSPHPSSPARPVMSRRWWTRPTHSCPRGASDLRGDLTLHRTQTSEWQKCWVLRTNENRKWTTCSVSQYICAYYAPSTAPGPRGCSQEHDKQISASWRYSAVNMQEEFSPRPSPSPAVCTLLVNWFPLPATCKI